MKKYENDGSDVEADFHSIFEMQYYVHVLVWYEYIQVLVLFQQQRNTAIILYLDI